MITEVFYLRSLNFMEIEVPSIQEASGVCISPFVDTDELKIALRAQNVSRALEECTDPSALKPGFHYDISTSTPYRGPVQQRA